MFAYGVSSASAAIAVRHISATVVHPTSCNIVATYAVTTRFVANGNPVVPSHATIPNRTTVGIESTWIVNVSMSSVIVQICIRMVMETEISTVVDAVYGIIPCSGSPPYRTQEIIGHMEDTPLPVEEDMPQIR